MKKKKNGERIILPKDKLDAQHKFDFFISVRLE